MRISVNATALDNTFRIAFVMAELEENVAYWICFDGSFWRCNKMLSLGSEGIFLFHIGEDHACPHGSAKPWAPIQREKATDGI